jgi:hypothetical protein
VYSGLLRHVEDYFFAGVLGFSAHMQNGDTYLHFPPSAYGSLMNLAAAISGNPTVSDINQEYTVIRSGTDGFQANVHTMFGTLIMSIGYMETGIYTFVFGLVAYGVFLANHRSPDVWLTVLWCFLAAGLAFGWFDNYFSHQPLIEVPFVCLLLSAVGRMTWRSGPSSKLVYMTQAGAKLQGRVDDSPGPRHADSM